MPWLLAGVAATAAAAPNVLVVIADDLGTDKLATYQGDVPGYTPVATDMPVTPMIDQLAADGVRFRTAWANALCSPTRAGLVTGQHAYRTGVGTVIRPTGTPILPLRFTTMAEALDPTYATGMFGKWHLGFLGRDADGDDDPNDWTTPGVHDAVPNPNRHGFEVFDGSLGGGIASYWNWTRIVSDGYGLSGGNEHSVVLQETEYATRVTAETAADFVLGAPEPFLAVVAFNAGHTDGNGLSRDHGFEGCSTMTDPRTPRQAYRAAVECLDHELDAILGALEGAGRLDETVIFFLGDNGTDPNIGDPDFPRASSGKGSPYEAGIHVPLIVAEGRHLDGAPYGTAYAGTPFAPGDLVRTGETSAALVGTLDVFDTVLSLAGVPAVTSDAISLAPHLLDPTLPARSTLYSELFKDPDRDGVFDGFAALRNGRYKLIVTQEDTGGAVPCQAEELYDLVADPGELVDRSEDAALAGVRQAARGNIDGRVTTYEASAGAPVHWLWREADGPTACD